MAEHHARTVVLRNSRIVCWMTMGIAIVSVLMGIWMIGVNRVPYGCKTRVGHG